MAKGAIFGKSILDLVEEGVPRRGAGKAQMATSPA